MSDEARISMMKAVVLMATALPALSHWELKVGGTRGSEYVGRAKLAGSLPRFLVRSGRPLVLMLIRSAAALATMKPERYLSCSRVSARAGMQE